MSIIGYAIAIIVVLILAMGFMYAPRQSMNATKEILFMFFDIAKVIMEDLPKVMDALTNTINEVQNNTLTNTTGVVKQ